MCINDTTIQYFQADDNNTLQIGWGRYGDKIALSVGILSSIGSLLILISFFAIKDLRTTTSRQILCYISLADLGCCLTQAIGAGVFFGDMRQCAIQGIFTVAFSLAFILWTTCLALYLYVSLVLDDLLAAKRLTHVFHFIGWGIPLAVALTAYFEDALGSDVSVATNGWCWVSIQPHVPPDSWHCRYAILLWMMVTVKGWEMLCYVIVPTLYFAIRLHIRDTMRGASVQVVTKAFRKAVKAIDKKLLLLPMAFVLLRIWGTIRMFLFLFYFYDVYDPRQMAVFQAFEYLQALGDNAQGFVNFILFFLMTKKVRRELLRRLAPIAECCQSLCTRSPADADGYYTSYGSIEAPGSRMSDDTIEMTDSSRLSLNRNTPRLGSSTLPPEHRRQVHRWFQQAHKRLDANSHMPNSHPPSPSDVDDEDSECDEDQ